MIVIHIGLPKAGSSTIQTFLDTYSDTLRELSVDYPRLGRVNRLAHHNFANELKSRADKFNPLSGGISDLIAYLRKRTHHTTVLSSEGFWTCSAEAIRRFAANLASLEEPIRIVLVIRDLIDFVPSLYAQAVRHGISVSDFDRFFEARQANDHFNAFETAGRWADAFGWNALVVRPLDPAILRGGDLITDFLVQLGLDPDLPALSGLSRRPRLNVSPGWMTLEAVRALFSGQSRLGPGHPLVSHLADDLPDFRKKRIGVAGEIVGGELGWNMDRGRYLTPVQAQWLHDAYLGVIDALNARLSCELPSPPSLEASGFVAREFMPDATHIPPAMLKGFYDAMAVEVDTAARRTKAIKKAAKAARK